jgi:branched-chain amino acid aminotransferase
MIKAAKENRIIEAFGAGTAAIVCPVQSFMFEGETYKIPIEEDKQAGKLTQLALKMMTDLQYGVVKRPDWQIDVCKA